MIFGRVKRHILKRHVRDATGAIQFQYTGSLQFIERKKDMVCTQKINAHSELTEDVDSPENRRERFRV